MNRSTTARPSWVLLLSAGVLVLAGGAPAPGGCGSGVAPSQNQILGLDQCDVIENGVSPCTAETLAGASTACGGASQCACENNGALFCGTCTTRVGGECGYCPAGEYCPTDPCGDTCIKDEQPVTCPAGAPLECGQVCCPLDHPACCVDSAWCGKDESACSEVDGSSDCAIPPGGCPSGEFSASSRAGCCTGDACLRACATCSEAWYETELGVFGPCATTDTGCVNNAAQAAEDAALKQGCD